jgi:hypothetical protein
MEDKYKIEVENKWGHTEIYKEYKSNTKDYSKNKWDNLLDELNSILYEFSSIMNQGNNPASIEAQELVYKLKVFITDNYYICTNEVLINLGQMYVSDERFKSNIDKHSNGTANYIKEAIQIYCKE